MPRPLRLTAVRIASLSLLTLAVALGCARPPGESPPPPPAPVLASAAQTRTVPVQFRAIGTVKTVSTVSVRPRVGGEVTGVYFAEGEEVTQGKKLFTIDPRPYEAAVKQAEATLAKDKATLYGAELDLKRIERIGGSVAAAELDSARTRVAAARAAVEADEAALRTARLQLEFTTVTSPLDGRAGAVLVTPGNLVSPSDPVPLVVINQISPIFVAFALPERQLPAVIAARRERPLRVEASVRDGGSPAEGVLAFVDNTVDATTGTIQLKAEFENKDHRLWPGQFVDVVLTVGERPDSVVVPVEAVQAGQHGRYVYVVTPEGTAELRPVVVADELGGEAVIASGLRGGEVVVVEGQLRLAPGAKVEVKSTGGTDSSRPRGGSGEPVAARPAEGVK
jgi:multidrug efflux system membrane fusion protein